MSCLYPLKGFFRFTSDGKKDIVFASDKNAKSVRKNGKVYPYPISIPCGHCIECRLSASREWSYRIMQECKKYNDNYMLTLTYDDLNVPLSDSGVMSLRKSDFQAFVKKLRTYYNRKYSFTGIRFYGAGEYGDHGLRPHYHIIFFNLPIFDLKKVDVSKTGFPLFESSFISSIWNKGLVRVNEVSSSSAAYVSRYVLKKQYGLIALSAYQDREPEFSLCSRRPGIGDNGFDPSIYHNDVVYSPRANGSPALMKPPRYYDKKFEVICPDKLKVIKDSRCVQAELSSLFAEKSSGLMPEEFRAKRIANAQSRVKHLPRNL